MHWCMNLHGQFVGLVLESITDHPQKLCLRSPREMLNDGDSVSDHAFIRYSTLLMEDAISFQNAFFEPFSRYISP